jgi:putative ABC transport system permease protein
MATQPDWKRIIVDHARATNAGHLPVDAIDELAAHLEDLYLEALESGLEPEDAQARAARALKESPLAQLRRPHTRIPESHLESSRVGIVGLAGDLRFAWRQARRSPSFAAVAILTLGLGAGAATAIFSIVDAVLLRPLPYRQPEQLVAIWDSNAEKALPRERVSPVTFMDERGLQAVFTDAAAWWRPEVNFVQPGMEPVRVSTVETSANLFQVLGVSPAFGPGFPVDGPFHAADPIAVISDRLWRTRFDASADVIGRLLDVNDDHYRIVGVMPPGFSFPDDVDIWLRLQWDLTRHSRGAHFMEAVARLKPGITAEQASRELAQLSARLGDEFPSTNRGWIARAVPLLDDMLGYYRPALFVLLGAVALLLVTACLNVASLLLARATARAREIAVRSALGASRARLVRQMLVESLALAAAGTLAGGAAAVVLVKLAIAAMPVDVPRLSGVTIDLRLLVFALAVVAATALLFGLLPAIVLARTDASEVLKDGASGATGARGHRWNRALVIGEVALASTVLVSSALLVRSVSRMLTANLGVVATGVVTGGVQVASAGYPDWPDVDQFYDALVEGIRREPGVDAAGAATMLPLEAGWRLPFGVEGRPPARAGDESVAQHVSVTNGYFETFRAPLLDGRLFTRDDRANTEPVVVVNRTFARQVFPGERAVGKRIISTAMYIGPLGRNLPGRVPFRIVGVVADVRQTPLSQSDEPVIYHTARQFPFRAMTIVARGQDTATVAAGMRHAVRALDPSLPVSDLSTMTDHLVQNAAAPRLLMFILTSFAVLIAILAAVGVYGLMACLVNDRRRELAIRLALGAQPSALAAFVTRQGLAIAAVGVAAGLVGAQLAGGLLRRVLFETPTTDAVALAGAGGVLLLAAAVACLAPARRAARVAPIEGLKLD